MIPKLFWNNSLVLRTRTTILNLIRSHEGGNVREFRNASSKSLLQPIGVLYTDQTVSLNVAYTVHIIRYRGVQD